IVSFSPNPKGSDTDNEWIEIENNSKKKINLKGWSIATGWEIFYNHPIRTDFKIKPGQTEKLTRDICAFTLANTKDKIKLRSPDGKAIQEITYDHGKKTIAEDELYQKNKDSWVWITPQKTTDLGGLQKQTSEVVARAPATSEQKLNTSITEIQAALGKYSAAPDEKKKLATRNDLVNYNLAVKFNLNAASPRVAGMATIRDISQPEKHWLVSWLDELWMEINSALNHLLNAA
ncbi:MAG: lamin tail domain-containing protein, partial [Candidatus Pacebacteria bacterium]|nr:lamin tail domain-containing protein [Candidatus Paceibacterota bacterium]